MKKYYVYIVRCRDSSYYVGITNNYLRRVWQHNEGLDPKSYTHNRRPVELVYLGIFEDVHAAIAWETKIKGWNKKKKEALIAHEHDVLPHLSMNSLEKIKACHIELVEMSTRRSLLICVDSSTGSE